MAIKADLVKREGLYDLM